VTFEDGGRQEEQKQESHNRQRQPAHASQCSLAGCFGSLCTGGILLFRERSGCTAHTGCWEGGSCAEWTASVDCVAWEADVVGLSRVTVG
jgi:hypothetical protein